MNFRSRHSHRLAAFSGRVAHRPSRLTIRCYASLLFCAASPLSLRAQTLTTLANFNGLNGAKPFLAPLIQGPDGSLYGTTQAGGTHHQGTVFKITTAGTLTTLYSFCARSKCADGAVPYAGLVLGRDGMFYGTTVNGGAYNSATHGDGTVFKMTPAGALTTLHSFNIHDGASPYAALIQATDGNFYGTTQSGGANLLGTVFKMTPQGTVTTLHSFNLTDGSSPEGALIQGVDRNFYGTTYNGGIEGYGTIFQITPGGVLTTLHVLSDTEGRGIVTGLVQGSDGNFYGTAGQSGANGYGAVFSTTPTGALTVLHAFNAIDGATPSALVLATDGNLYGPTASGGAHTNGTLYEVSPQSSFTSLLSFTGSDGAFPFGGLVQATDGKFYGTTFAGGSKNDGVVFQLDLGLGPFVKTIPTAGRAGTNVKLLGSSLTGATSVTFNGAPALFTVISPSEIAATVPSGATTGTVQVSTPTGTLLSNMAFQLIP